MVITLAITTIIHHIYVHIIMNILICTYMYLTSDQVAEEMASLVAAHRLLFKLAQPELANIKCQYQERSS